MTILGKEIAIPAVQLPPQLTSVDLGSLLAVGVFLAYLATAFIA